MRTSLNKHLLSHNIDFMKFSDGVYAINLLRECLDAGLNPLFCKEQTRITRKSCSAIGNVYFEGFNNQCSSCIPEFDISDHLLLFTLTKWLFSNDQKQIQFMSRSVITDAMQKITQTLLARIGLC